jgi:predicted AlkP superfamily phosphohydrolase/phosphomutase
MCKLRTNAALAAGIIALGGCGSGGEAERAEPPRAATTLIGLDGCDWRNALPLVRQGKLPVLAALERAGTRAVMLTNPDYRWSPVLWTTIATGKLPDKTGVTNFFARVQGIERPIPTPSVARRCKAIWNIFSEESRTVGFVGWWVTWPAEPVNGFMVSDHFSTSRFHFGDEFEREVEEAAYYVQQTYPEELVAEIRPLKVGRERVTRADFARFADLPEGWELPAEFRKFDKASEFAIAHSVDRTHFAVGEKLLRERDPELFGVFLEGIDVMQHFFWEFMDPEGPGTSPSLEDRRTYGEAIERYYRFSDGLVGRLVEAGGSERAVMIVSDHGFRPDTERWADKGISGEHRRQAFFLWAGPGIRRGARLPDLDAVDVTPSILAYHCVPRGRDMDGEPALAALLQTRVESCPPREVDTWEGTPRERVALPAESATRDLEERIRALGYID